jgi:5-methylcytosine-specific restriction endonuclease McrA
VLNQNNGTQAAVISAIAEFRRRHAGVTLLAAKGMKDDYNVLCSQAAQTVSAQPINYLQNFAGQTDQFLFERVRGGVVLMPGVTYCLRRFQPLVQQLARQHWVDHVKHNRLNAPMLGQRDDLESFLFETSRQSLLIIGDGLRKLAGSQCFYCQSKVNEADVDHFVPFSLYPRDLIHNFVLAHPGCNRSKSDTLAAKLHLERWLAFISQHDTTLREIGAEAGHDSDVSASHAIARWGYGNAIASGARAWVKAGAYEPVDDSYLGYLT